MRWFTGYKVHGSPLRGLSLNLSILNFLNNFFHGILSRPSEIAFFMSRIAFCLMKKCGHIHELLAVKGGHFVYFMAFLLKINIFSPMLLINKGLFSGQTKWYPTQKKRLFQMAYFKFHEKKYWESSKLTNSKINPSRENHAHCISCKPPHNATPKSTLGLHFDSFKSQHQLLRNLKFYLLHFIWVPLYHPPLNDTVKLLNSIFNSKQHVFCIKTVQ